MSTKLRIYELAKELGLENKAVLEMCEQMGFHGKASHSNTLSDEEADKIRRSVLRKAVNERGESVREVRKEGAVVTEHRVGNVIRRRKKSGADDDGSDVSESPAPKTLDLTDAPKNSFSMDAFQPDLAAERDSRDAALKRADALFSTPAAESVSTTVIPPVIPAPELGAESEPVEEEVEVADVIQASEPTLQDVSVVAPAEGSARKSELRGPKVLGRIELPQRPAPRRPEPVASKVAGIVPGVVDEDRGVKSKSKKKTDGIIEDDDTPRRIKKKQVLRKDDLLDYEGERDVWRTAKKKGSKRSREDGPDQANAMRASKRVVKIDNLISVGELARQMGTKATELITHLMNLGVMAGINQTIDFDTATLVAEQFGYTISNTGIDEAEVLKTLKAGEDDQALELRPPVVTVMGHVDHGKTSLLDAIRKTSVTTGEAGGITQHIGAYNVQLKSGGSVTFLDTPGHEAFTAMRSRGAKVTDIVVLVVAADDGIMPQTIEAINHAKAAGVPIIVAANKIDKAGANLDRIRTQLSEQGLVTEEWGGETILVPVSAHTKAGIDTLLENLHAQAEILDLKANPSRNAIGTVVESKLDKGRGPVTTVLVQNGTLKRGDIFLAGATWGRVRALYSDDGKQIESAGPSIPVEVLGASIAPLAGDDFFVFETEAEAKDFAEKRAVLHHQRMLSQRGGGALPLTLENFSELVQTGDVRELPLIVKGDVQGSVEAVSESLSRMAFENARVKLIHKGVGAVTENDVQLAIASNAVIVAFNIRADSRAQSLAETSGVEILYSRIIYEIVESIEKSLKGILDPKLKETTLGRVEVRQTFRVPRLGLIAGSYVMDGNVQRGAFVRLLRDNRVIYEGKMASLRRFKEDVKEVSAGYECGIGIEGYSDIQNGDVIEVYKVEQVPH